MNRREFSKTLLSGGALAPFLSRPIASARAATATQPQKISVISRGIEVKGRAAKVFGLVGPDGKPGVILPAGEIAAVDLANEISEETLVHWHGITPAWDSPPLLASARSGPTVASPVNESGD